MGYRIRNGNRVGYRIMVRITDRVIGRLMDKVRDRDEVFWGIRSPECLSQGVFVQSINTNGKSPRGMIVCQSSGSFHLEQRNTPMANTLTFIYTH